jgi:uncharacterized damage-inducible protein DinB
MQLGELEALYDYNYWANRRLLDAVARLTCEEFTRDVAGSYGSVRNTLVHILSAEWGWLERCGGASRGPRLDPANFPDVRTLIRTWARVEHDMRVFLAGLDDADLDRPVEFALGGPAQVLPLGVLLQHAALHAVHHRGQAALLVRSLSAVPGNFDLLLHAGERAASGVRVLAPA